MESDEIARRIRRGLFRNLEDIAAFEPKVEGVQSGLPFLDKLTGGLRPGKLNLVAGYSHHGKTSLMLTTLVNNIFDDNFTGLVISGDDTDDMILTKIIAFCEDMSTEDVENAGPKWRMEYVRSEFKNKLLIATPQESDSYTIGECLHIYDEACQQFGKAPNFGVFDYLALLKTNSQGEAMDVRNKARQLKSMFRQNPDTVWLVGTQCNKIAEDVNALTLNHMEYGGHQDADGVVIGVRRKSNAKMDDVELRAEEFCPTTHVSVMKNKITGRKSSNPVGVPLALDKTSGIIREMRDSDKAPMQRQAQVIQFSTPTWKAQTT